MPPQNGFAVSKHLDLLRLKPQSFQKWHQKFVLQKTPTVSQNKNASAQRSQACPACRKPLPRCSVCLIHMGGIAAVEGGFLVKKSAKRKTKPFSLFFTWCQYYKTFLLRQGQMKYTKLPGTNNLAYFSTPSVTKWINKQEHISIANVSSLVWVRPEPTIVNS